MYICVQSGRVFKQLKAPTAIYEPVAEWSKVLRSTYYVRLSISFLWRGFESRLTNIFLYFLNHYRTLHMGIH